MGWTAFRVSKRKRWSGGTKVSEGQSHPMPRNGILMPWKRKPRKFRQERGGGKFHEIKKDNQSAENSKE